MEGAVRSGYLAAEAILSDCGEPRRLLKPDLPAEGLSRHWVRNAASDSFEMKTGEGGMDAARKS